MSGDILVDRFDGDDLVVKSVSGDLEVGLPGAIRVKPEDRDPQRYHAAPRAAHRARSSGTATARRVAFRSVSGDITIRRIDG